MRRHLGSIGGRWVIAAFAGLLLMLAAPPEAAQAATITVTTNDGGPVNNGDGLCSLREAIQNARNNALTNANCLVAGQAAPAVDEIRFNIGGGGPQTIALTSGLDSLEGGPLVLDASTQPGPGALPRISLDGNGAGAGASGFQVTATGVTIRGFAIGRFNANGILIDSPLANTTVEGNYVGIDRLGQTAQPNGVGVRISQATTTAIGGTSASQRNVISGNTGAGVVITVGVVSMQGNYIGTDAAGAVAVANGGNGIEATSSTFIRIGEATAGAGNLISGNGGHGFRGMGQGQSLFVTLLGNRIGTNLAGTAAIPNALDGINFDDSSSGPTIGIDLPNGSSAQSGNLISGNGRHGIFVARAPATTIAGNLIGVNAAGTAAIPNQQDGIRLDFAGAIIGEVSAAPHLYPSNVISGNGQSGVRVLSNNSIVQINNSFIGTNKAGTAAIPNQAHGVHAQGQLTFERGQANEYSVISGNAQHGILFEDMGPLVSPNVTIVRNVLIGLNLNAAGGIPNGGNGVTINNSNKIYFQNRGNISFNTGAGIFVDAASSEVQVQDYSIDRNGGLGIDLAPAGVNPNDALDPDSGANNRVNYPVITSAIVDGTATVSGTLNTVPNDQFEIRLYNSAACDPSGFGEGAVPLGFQGVTTDASGNATWSISGLTGLTPGTVVTATATGPFSGQAAGVSEFSACRTLVTPTAGSIIVSPTQITTSESGRTATFTIALTSQPTANVTIPISSSNPAEGSVSVTQVVFTTANWNVPQTVTVTGVDDGHVDGTVAYTVVVGPAVSADPAFNGVNPADVAATNLDDESTLTGPTDPTDPGNGDDQGQQGKPKNEKEDDVRETETQRQQRERTNRSGSDDVRTEGNVVSVDPEASPRTATIATRDGLQVVVLYCRDSCDEPQVGDYLEADGVKEHEALFYADSVTSRRPGR